MKRALWSACALVACASLPAGAQSLPSTPIVFADGHVTVSGDVSWSFAAQRIPPESVTTDTRFDPGFFNYTDYERSALRMLRADLSASIAAGDHFAVLGELRSENANRPRAYALYVRIRPWIKRAIDFQVGRVPPTFGAFARRTYAADNPLIGYPLAYQYLTSLRPDSLPANADELLKMRGRGWFSNYSIGTLAPHPGVPLVSAFRWDTGVQVHAGGTSVEATASVTNGTVSNPLVRDDNGGKQVAGRLVWRPVAGLVLGGSVARGPFITSEAARSARGNDVTGDFAQTAWGGDAEFSRNHYLVRFETILSDWRLPVVGSPAIDQPLRGYGTSLEGRYKILPRLYLAARGDWLEFSKIVGTGRTDTWDANVTRFETGGGYSIQRNLILKLSYQHNKRQTTRVPRLDFAAAQLLFWF